MQNNPYSKVLQEIEIGLWEHDIRVKEELVQPYQYDDATFRACLKIFMSSVMWKLWEYTTGMEFDEKSKHTENFGYTLRSLIIEYTGIDTLTLYDDSQKSKYVSRNEIY